MKTESTARKQVGVWIDHREAIVVAASGSGTEVRRITSNVEKQLRRSSLPPYGVAHESHESHATPPDDEQQRAYGQHLARYYEEIVACLDSADTILLMGPGEARGELNKHLVEHSHPGRVITMMTADRMTERQVVEKVRRFFFPPRPERAGRAGGPGPVRHP